MFCLRTEENLADTQHPASERSSKEGDYCMNLLSTVGLCGTLKCDGVSHCQSR